MSTRRSHAPCSPPAPPLLPPLPRPHAPFVLFVVKKSAASCRWGHEAASTGCTDGHRWKSASLGVQWLSSFTGKALVRLFRNSARLFLVPGGAFGMIHVGVLVETRTEKEQQ
jgi:hypothetical protein